MKVSARVVVIAAMGAAVMVTATGASASVAAKAKEVPASKYAKSMCTVYNTIVADYEEFQADLVTASNAQTDPAAFQVDVEVLATELLGKIAVGERKLKRIYPDVDDGKKVGKQFAKNPVEVQRIVGDTVDEFLAADPTSPAFSASVTVFEVALSTLATQLTDVTTGIDNQDFIEAVGDEKQCHEIFPVTGG